LATPAGFPLTKGTCGDFLPNRSKQLCDSRLVFRRPSKRLSWALRENGPRPISPAVAIRKDLNQSDCPGAAGRQQQNR